ncbi:MAG: hypothetical protein IJ572_01375 [Bacilli bacterium]|nr:hypothetical protein [Bacilli bacterium]
MDSIKFSSLQDLYNRIKPALRSKVKELKLDNKKYISEEDIFKYLSETKWANANNLTLDEMVDDILYLDNDKIDSFVQDKIIKNKIDALKEKDEIYGNNN